METMDFKTFKAGAKKAFAASPFELKLFFFFSVLVSVISIGIRIFGDKALIESILPFTGKSMSLCYPFCIIMLLPLLIIPRTKNIIKSRNLLLLLLLINIVHEVILFVGLSNEDSFNTDSYLSINHWRLLWVVFIPSCWILMLLSPRIKKYCEYTTSTPSL